MSGAFGDADVFESYDADAEDHKLALPLACRCCCARVTAPSCGLRGDAGAKQFQATTAALRNVYIA